MDFAETWSKCSPKQVLQTSVGLKKCIFWRQYGCSRAEWRVLVMSVLAMKVLVIRVLVMMMMFCFNGLLP